MYDLNTNRKEGLPGEIFCLQRELYLAGEDEEKGPEGWQEKNLVEWCCVKCFIWVGIYLEIARNLRVSYKNPEYQNVFFYNLDNSEPSSKIK